MKLSERRCWLFGARCGTRESTLRALACRLLKRRRSRRRSSTTTKTAATATVGRRLQNVKCVRRTNLRFGARFASARQHLRVYGRRAQRSHTRNLLNSMSTDDYRCV